MGKANGNTQRWSPMEMDAPLLGPTWVALLAMCPHEIGIFEINYDQLIDRVEALRERKTSRAYLHDALILLENTQHLKLYPKRIVWLLDRFSYVCARDKKTKKLLPIEPTDNRLVGYREYLSRFSAVWSDFRAYAPCYVLPEVPTKAPSDIPPVGAQGEIESKSKKVKEEEDSASSDAATTRPSSRKREAEDPDLVALAERLHGIIQAGIEKLNLPHGKLKLDPQATARTLRLLRDSDGMDIADLQDVLQWASDAGGWPDRTSGQWVPWIKVLLSPENWRKKTSNGANTKLGAAYCQWDEDGRPQATQAVKCQAPPTDTSPAAAPAALDPEAAHRRACAERGISTTPVMSMRTGIYAPGAGLLPAIEPAPQAADDENPLAGGEAA